MELGQGDQGSRDCQKRAQTASSAGKPAGDGAKIARYIAPAA